MPEVRPDKNIPVANAPSGSADTQQLLRLGDFAFDVPVHLIAQTPLASRDHSRLLIWRHDVDCRHMQVTDLTLEIPPGALLIFNNTKVFPSRLLGALPTGGAVEIFLLSPVTTLDSTFATWRALGRPLKKLRPGTRVHFAAGLTAEVLRRDDLGATATVDLVFSIPTTELHLWLDIHGYVPLPPYIKRAHAEPASKSPDSQRYQTVYAKQQGSVAAPTAGLHFTPQLIGNLESNGVEVNYVSLHVGAGTFLPVKTPDLSQHSMHVERYQIGTATANAVLAARASGRPVIAVGTTTLRALEDFYQRCAGDDEEVRRQAEGWHETSIFIYPKTAANIYRPRIIDALFTNFHQPESTLFMLVSALIGFQAAKDLYQLAVTENYRFFSYGDACLLWLDRTSS